MAKTAREEAQKNIAENRKAFHDYHILETFEAGVALLGTEVKSIREGNVNLRDSFARVEAGEVWIYNVHISPYSHRGYADHEPTRRRKLLLHRQRDPQADREDGREGHDARADADVLQERPREGRASAWPRARRRTTSAKRSSAARPTARRAPRSRNARSAVTDTLDTDLW